MGRSVLVKMMLAVLVSAIAVPGLAAEGVKAGQIRVGIIGLDAHAVPWTKSINNPQAKAPISDMRIVAAYPAYSKDIPFSNDNIKKNIAIMQGLGVEMVDSIPALMPKVDAVMVLSIDGRPHLEQAKPAIAAKKILYVDKPVAASLADASKRQGGRPVSLEDMLQKARKAAGVK
jgi:predicted dehydrogenase